MEKLFLVSQLKKSDDLFPAEVHSSTIFDRCQCSAFRVALDDFFIAAKQLSDFVLSQI
jgi:hypothetical protein